MYGTVNNRPQKKNLQKMNISNREAKILLPLHSLELNRETKHDHKPFGMSKKLKREIRKKRGN